MAAVGLKTPEPNSCESIYARAMPIITGTAAPLRVLGRAASTQALNEFCFIGKDFFKDGSQVVRMLYKLAQLVEPSFVL